MPSAQLSAGLPDDAFTHDGLLTKRVLRAYALALLAPRGDELLWDLGAGCGSIGVEWCRLHAGNRAIAVERDAVRAARIPVNAAALGAAGRIDVVESATADALPTLPAPDAVFVGGGLSTAVLDAAWAALRPSGRLVAHSVTAESDAVLLDAYKRHGGELTRIGVETAAPIAHLTGFTPARSVLSWAATNAEATTAAAPTPSAP